MTYLGLPTVLDDDELEDNLREAETLMDEEEPFGANIADPRRRAALDPGSIYNKSQQKLSARDLATLKQRFPRLKEFSDEFLNARSMEELLKIESTSIKLKEAERRGDVEDRLALNKQNLESSVFSVPGGLDNRWTVLHSARFLGGAACSTKKLWIGARDQIDVNGHSPVANYDMGSVGLGGFVTNKGWVELANPGSTKIALKLFSINNVGSRSSAAKQNFSGVQELDEIGELDELKLALRTLRTAAQFVCPWNFSYLALENFLIQHRFFSAELSGTEKPASILAQFVDYVLHENANR